jgi:hypothetical protein
MLLVWASKTFDHGLPVSDSRGQCIPTADVAALRSNLLALGVATLSRHRWCDGGCPESAALTMPEQGSRLSLKRSRSEFKSITLTRSPKIRKGACQCGGSRPCLWAQEIYCYLRP